MMPVDSYHDKNRNDDDDDEHDDHDDHDCDADDEDDDDDDDDGGHLCWHLQLLPRGLLLGGLPTSGLCVYM